MTGHLTSAAASASPAPTPAPEPSGRALGLVYPPAGRNRDYTGMQLAFIGGVAEAATAHDYDVLLSPADRASDSSFRRMVDRGRVDGVIVMEIKLEDDRVEHLARTGFPFVTIGRNSRAEETSWVDLDFAGLARGCVYHLADLGHRRIAFVNRSEQLFQSGYGFAHLGLEGYTKAMAEQVLTPHAYLCDDEVTMRRGGPGADPAGRPGDHLPRHHERSRAGRPLPGSPAARPQRPARLLGRRRGHAATGRNR